MPKGYWIAQVDVSDMEPYKKYSDALDGSLKKYGGRFLVRGGKSETVEGKPRSRHVVIEFPTIKLHSIAGIRRNTARRSRSARRSQRRISS